MGGNHTKQKTGASEIESSIVMITCMDVVYYKRFKI